MIIFFRRGVGGLGVERMIISALEYFRFFPARLNCRSIKQIKDRVVRNTASSKKMDGI